MAAWAGEISEYALMIAKEKVFYFWGAMDLIGIVFYSIDALRLLVKLWESSAGNPAVIIFMMIANGINGILTGVFYFVYILTPLTLFVSAWLFFKKSRYAVRFAMAQEVFRVLTLQCSVTLFPVVVGASGMTGATVNISKLLLSEILKVGSLIYVRKKQ
ncbi:hypothetical protein ACP26F_13120 [Franconibacter pulveris 1160]|uniref:Uncharacterized protein n=1 Tax=Franconibacter daqui TaxID=2047724 RepID=A0ABV1PQ52_9ENTR|nr:MULTISPECIES: hypothetical protein [Franconibacter]MCK1968478.1 hypothetical protein [Franconibacter sp. IITDAS19]GGD20044.1 hypothetical protein GCM10011513_16870 [Franconibacter daqui]